MIRQGGDANKVKHVAHQNGDAVSTPVAHVPREDAEAPEFARDMDERYEKMFQGDCVRHDLVED